MGNNWAELQRQANMVSSSESSPEAESTFDTPGDLFDCPDCGRPIMQSAKEHHAANCAEINKLQSGQSKKRKLSDAPSNSKSSQGDSKKAPAPAANASNATAPSPAASEKPLPKKAKTQPIKDANKVKKTKSSGPVNPNEQCAVPNEAGVPCARSITCKIHSISLRRAVQRSFPFETCLAEWQRKNAKPVTAGGAGSSGPGSKPSHGQPGAPGSDKKSALGAGGGAGGKKARGTDGQLLPGQGHKSKGGVPLASTPMFLGEQESESDGEGDGGRSSRPLNVSDSDQVDSEEEADFVLQGLAAARSKLKPFPGSELAGAWSGFKKPAPWKAQIAAAFLPVKRAAA